MTDHGDEGDDDPQLGGLRAAWLTMPDEDPPQRGLAELMAAARVKADEMAQPSLWQRIVALLKRPPVLALATMMVLIAGAVLVGNRRTKIESASPTAAPSLPAEMTAGGHAEPPLAPAATPLHAPAADPGNAATIDTLVERGAREEAPPAEPPRPRGQSAQPPAKTKALRSPPATGATKKPMARGEDMLDGDGQADEPANKRDEAREVKAEAKAKPKAAKTGETLQLATPEPEAPDDSEVRAGSAPPTAATSEPTTTAAPTTKPQQGAAQLHAQARTAASRNDCAAVKVMVQRIAKQDPAYYRANVTNDASITKCTGTALH